MLSDRGARDAADDVARRRSAARTRGPRGPACPACGRSGAATHLAASAPTPRPAPQKTVPRTAPTTSTADAPVSAEVMQPPIETSVVSATAASPPPLYREDASTSRVRNQRCTSSGVAGLCDRRCMGHLLGYARVSTTDQQPHLQVDALEHAGCYRVFTETASGDRPVLEQVLDQLRPVTPWSSGSSTASAAPCGTWSTPSPGWPTAASGSAASKRRLTPLPGRQAGVPCVRRLGRFRTRSHPRAHGRGAGGRSGPRPPRRSAVGDDRPQAPGGARDVSLWAIHSRCDRQGPWS
jgi:hypothetical protein